MCSIINFTGAVVLQPLNRFGRADRPEAIRLLECTGSETHISQCEIDSDQVEDCGQLEIAGVVCQSMYISILYYCTVFSFSIQILYKGLKMYIMIVQAPRWRVMSV